MRVCRRSDGRCVCECSFNVTIDKSGAPGAVDRLLSRGVLHPLLALFPATYTMETPASSDKDQSLVLQRNPSHWFTRIPRTLCTPEQIKVPARCPSPRCLLARRGSPRPLSTTNADPCPVRGVHASW